MSSETDSIFYLSLATIVAGVCGLAIRLCYKSRCSDIDFGFGCIHIHRVVEAESNIEIRDSISGPSSRI